jgi:hypothetical protein
MRTSAKTEEVFEGTFECRHCEFQAEATVHAIGWGGAGGVGTDARALAAQDALEDAGAVASRSITCVPCPQCGKLDPSARSYRLQVIGGSVLIGVFSGFAAYAYAHARYGGAGEMTWLFSVFGLAAAAAAFWKWSRPWIGVRERVIIHHAGAVTATVVKRGKPRDG